MSTQEGCQLFELARSILRKILTTDNSDDKVVDFDLHRALDRSVEAHFKLIILLLASLQHHHHHVVCDPLGEEEGEEEGGHDNNYGNDCG